MKPQFAGKACEKMFTGLSIVNKCMNYKKRICEIENSVKDRN